MRNFENKITRKEKYIVAKYLIRAAPSIGNTFTTKTHCRGASDSPFQGHSSRFNFIHASRFSRSRDSVGHSRYSRAMNGSWFLFALLDQPTNWSLNSPLFAIVSRYYLWGWCRGCERASSGASSRSAPTDSKGPPNATYSFPHYSYERFLA